jgi:hypothetical protein
MLQPGTVNFSEQSTIRTVLAVKGEEGRRLLYTHGYDIGEGFTDIQSQYQSLRDAARNERLRDLAGLLAKLNRPKVALPAERRTALDGLVGTGASRLAASEVAQAGSWEDLEALLGQRERGELEAGTEYLVERVRERVSGTLDAAGEANLRRLARQATASEMARRS